MPYTAPNTVRLIFAVADATWGWRKDEKEMSFEELQQATGIKGKDTLSRAIKDAIAEGYIWRYGGNGRHYVYGMVRRFGNQTPNSVSRLVSKPLEFGNQTPNGDKGLVSKLAINGINETGGEGNEPSPFLHNGTAHELDAQFLPQFETDGSQAEMEAALATATAMKIEYPPHQKKITPVAKGLLGIGVTGQEIGTFYCGPDSYWYQCDWRGMKGQRPRLQDIESTIGLAASWDGPGAVFNNGRKPQELDGRNDKGW